MSKFVKTLKAIIDYCIVTSPLNGKVNGKSVEFVPIGGKINIKCDEGYRLSKSGTISMKSKCVFGTALKGRLAVPIEECQGFVNDDLLPLFRTNFLLYNLKRNRVQIECARKWNFREQKKWENKDW
ncbi:hypothetical protein MHBO_000655 [Bonamia ostreae]|uniref:Uncharacterized protein n=1 Tax=Bonamia ostreae TaxID=126728 RepID=A0ABV2AGD0_9EUKA